MSRVTVMTIGICMVAAVQAPTVFGAQGIPDYSGKWVPIPGRTVPAGLPDGGPFVITQTATTFAIIWPNEQTSYMLDGSPTKREEKEGNTVRAIVATAHWLNSKLTVTEKYEGEATTREIAYQLDPADRSLTVSTKVTLLHTRGGALTVSTIGVTRVYKKG